jgi:hypothetical protein
MILISVKIVNKLYNYNVHPYDSIYSLKVKIFEEHKFSIRDMILETGGKVLLDSMPVSEYNTINLNLKLRGGKIFGLTKKGWKHFAKGIFTFVLIMVCIYFFINLLFGTMPVVSKILYTSLNTFIYETILPRMKILSTISVTEGIQGFAKYKEQFKILFMLMLYYLVKVGTMVALFIVKFVFIGYIVYLFTAFVIYITQYSITGNHCKSLKLSEIVGFYTGVTYTIAYGFMQLSPISMLLFVINALPKCLGVFLVILRDILVFLEGFISPKIIYKVPMFWVIPNIFYFTTKFMDKFVDVIIKNGKTYDSYQHAKFNPTLYTYKSKAMTKMLWILWKPINKYSINKNQFHDGNFAGVISFIVFIISFTYNKIKQQL